MGLTFENDVLIYGIELTSKNLSLRSGVHRDENGIKLIITAG